MVVSTDICTRQNVFLFRKNYRQKGNFLWEFIAQKISDLYMAEPKALDVRLVLNQFLRYMRFETYEQAGLKIRNIPFELDVFPHSFLVRARKDKLLSFACRISKSLLGIQKAILTWFSKYFYLKISWNWPLTRNRSGLKWSGSGKSIGLNITDSNEAF